jgi:hypothetical protein
MASWIGSVFSRIVPAIAVAAFVASPSVATTYITPLNYSFDQPSVTSTYDYQDLSFTKLTDGIVRPAGWQIAEALGWVGWTVSLPDTIKIDFVFSGPVSIDAVEFGTTQDKWVSPANNKTDVVLPSLRIYASNDKVSWALKGELDVPFDPANGHDFYDPSPSPFLTVGNLGIYSRYVRVEVLPNSNGNFTFADEVRFDSGAPELSTWALMLVGFAGLGFAGLRAPRRGAATVA